MNNIKIIFHVWKAKPTKNGRWKMRMQVAHDTIITCFLSDKQLSNLECVFRGMEDSFYSQVIYGAFDNDRYIWCGLDPIWLAQAFNADSTTIPDPKTCLWPNQMPVLEVPENVEIADEFKDFPT